MDKLATLQPIIAAHAHELKQPGVLSIRPGYRMGGDWPTRDPAIVVIVSPDAPIAHLPKVVDGTPVDIRRATPVEALRFKEPDRFARLAEQHAELRGGAFPEVDPPGVEAIEAPELIADVFAAKKKPQIPYTPPPHTSLKPVTGKITMTCHASPDAGWPTLRTFLNATERSLTVGLYDFTAKHILDGVENALAGQKQLTLTLDNPTRNPTADQTDSQTLKILSHDLGDSVQSAWALVRSNKAVPQWIYPTAYHIKVAVRDSAAVWLSSGNWNNSNQPDFDPIGAPTPDDQKTARKSDRDWHVIIEHEQLAKTYEAYLAHDFEMASALAAGDAPTPLAAAPGEVIPPEFAPAAHGQWSFFAPRRLENELATVTPLLTPDPGVYRDAMLSLLQSATQKLYIQLQYIHPSDVELDAPFRELVDVVARKITDGLDVRIITSQWQLSNGWLERLQSAGVDLDTVKIQNGVHNKGFLVDGKRVALGSQNWSGDGVLRNRDAAVIIDNSSVASYYEQIFLHDWYNIARKSVSA